VDPNFIKKAMPLLQTSHSPIVPQAERAFTIKTCLGAVEADVPFEFGTDEMLSTVFCLVAIGLWRVCLATSSIASNNILPSKKKRLL